MHAWSCAAVGRPNMTQVGLRSKCSAHKHPADGLLGSLEADTDDGLTAAAVAFHPLAIPSARCAVGVLRLYGHRLGDTSDAVDNR